MDAADFWQQARAPFAHTALQQQQQQSQQPQQQQHHLLPHNVSNQEQHVSPSNNNHLPLQNKLDPHQLQQQQSHQQQQHQQQQQQPQQQQQLLQQHVEHCYGNEAFGSHQTLASAAATSTQLSSHHLLFNAAAAAAAAAHLKSSARSNINVEPSATKQQQQQPQIVKDAKQPADQAYSSDYFEGTGNPEHMQHQEHHKQQQQQEPLQSTHPPQSPTLAGHGQGQLPSRPLSQGQQSPQHSITPSGGCSTPDIKYNNDKLANEIQLQLSRSSSAAAISERTLEECWSTLQRLFMHKSAMQQIQQQIPRVGLGVHGVASGASMGGGTTPGAETKPHQCQQCMKSFSSNHQLVQHIRVHTGEKPYKCSYCDRRFKQLSHVQQHTRLHTGERPYKCHLPDCGRAFIQLSNLQQHLRNHDAQVERAKNRPFHCNICGKGFATESSLRTHTSKELQLHLGVLQQHAALIGGPNATSCPVCHKLFLGTEALMDHMKNLHKEKSPPPSASTALPSEPLPSAFSDAIHGSSGSAPCSSELNCGNQPSTTTSGSSLNESYLGKRRTANHPCPVCGKHYVNEGSLRKHLACHAETSQLTSSLRMWPCSVCQAVFTHENGLLTHMDHMRMDPKHQFAAQYVLSRAAAEQRERESLLAATLVATSAGNGVRDSTCMLPLGVGSVLTAGGGSNSLCPSPSANSECSSNGRLSSSSTSDQEPDQDQEQDAEQGLSENENSSHNNNISNVNNNNNRMNINNNCSDKLHLSELRLPSSVTSQYSIDAELHANRMSLMAAASAAAAAVAASAGSRSQDGSLTDAVSSGPGNAAVQAAVVNSLAAAMRLNNSNNQQQLVERPLHHQPQSHHHHQHQHQPQQQQLAQQQQQQAQQQQQQAQNAAQHQQLTHLPLPAHHCSSSTGSTRRSPNLNVPSLQLPTDTSSVMMSMMRGTLDRSLDSSLVGSIHQIDALHHQHQHQHVHQASSYSQNAIAPSSQQNASHHPDTALRMHQQAEAILRTHKEAAFRLAASVAATNIGTAAASTAVKMETTAPKLNGDLHQTPQHAQSQQEQQQQQQTGSGHNS